MDNYFADLNAVNVNEHTEKKNGLTYLSWAWAWGELKKRHPLSFYTVYENKDGWNYFTDGKTAWVKTGVTVVSNDASVVLEHIEYLPIMDTRNRSIPADAVTSFDVNKAIQRSLTKACARHGLGLYIYAGEDLPEDTTFTPITAANEKKPYETVICANCNKEIKPTRNSKGVIQSVQDQVEFSQKAFGKDLCLACAQEAWSGK
ncbi:MAG: DUF1071 domain-containing protein [Oscillospiraceae bacterium]|nr:DUF1071 domain-containing protein [Oscillospiraceae bacterium]